MTRRTLPPNWTPHELDVVRTNWAAGIPMDEMCQQLPNRTPRSIQNKAALLGVRRPAWFTKDARSRGGYVGAMARHGRRNFWSIEATDRLLRITKERGVEEAARVCRVTVEQAKGRLYRIGFRFTEEKPPEPEESDIVEPQLPDADRIGRLVARFKKSTRGARQHGTQAEGR